MTCVPCRVSLASFTDVQKHCLCIECILPQTPPNCSIEQNISLPNGKRLPTGWAFLCNKMGFQALPTNFCGICSIGWIFPLLSSLASPHQDIQSLPPNCNNNLIHLDPLDFTIAAAFFFANSGSSGRNTEKSRN
ncbi:hypothetical protein H1C71_005195 [Ictidomys tridecemlineatus]|nr:hypothetical protein H1C71_005195 [Ictidomys tridecemlineatus]